MDDQKPTATPEEISRNGEKKVEDSDPFPPEGTTDEHLLRGESRRPITEDESVKATKAVVNGQVEAPK